jgi:hypothetical protein
MRGRLRGEPYPYNASGLFLAAAGERRRVALKRGEGEPAEVEIALRALF